MKHSAALALTCACMLSACSGGLGSPPPAVSTSYPVGISFANVQGVSVNALTFLSLGVNSAQSIVATQLDGSGTLSESDTCSSSTGKIATVTAQSNANGSATYVVTPVNAGDCKITVSGGPQYSATLDVSITVTSFPVQ